MFGYRKLNYPESPDHSKPGDYERYRRESDEWWDNWSHNFGLSLKLLLAGTLTVIALMIVGGIIAQILNG